MVMPAKFGWTCGTPSHTLHFNSPLLVLYSVVAHSLYVGQLATLDVVGHTTLAEHHGWYFDKFDQLNARNRIHGTGRQKLHSCRSICNLPVCLCSSMYTLSLGEYTAGCSYIIATTRAQRIWMALLFLFCVLFGWPVLRFGNHWWNAQNSQWHLTDLIWLYRISCTWFEHWYDYESSIIVDPPTEASETAARDTTDQWHSPTRNEDPVTARKYKTQTRRSVGGGLDMPLSVQRTAEFVDG